MDDESGGFACFVRSLGLAMVGIFSVPKSEEPSATNLHIVVHDINPIEATDGNYGEFLVVAGTLLVFAPEFGKFALEYGREEVSVSTSRFEETGVGP